jgi:FKBP-type peptidyl-prolyl cis-trans isomerase (trigger factor)
MDKLKIFPFETLISSPYAFVEMLSNELKIPAPDLDTIKKSIDDTYKALKADTRTDGTRNFKSEYKEKKKKEVIRYIENDKRLDSCYSLFKQIIDNAKNTI